MKLISPLFWFFLTNISFAFVVHRKVDVALAWPRQQELATGAGKANHRQSCHASRVGLVLRPTTNARECNVDHTARACRLYAHLPRRDFVATGAAALTGATTCTAADAQATTIDATKQTEGLVADLPMIRLKLPRGGFGREYVAIPLMINEKGPFEFMVDTGLTTEFITPHLQQVLGLQADKSNTSTVKGLAAGGESAATTLIELRGAALCCGRNMADNRAYPLPLLHAVITDFPQEHIDPAHDPVEGMLGMEMLSLFDVDFDFPANRIRFWKPGTAAKAIEASNQQMVAIPAVVINETGLIGIRLTTPQSEQPILGFLDCGSSFSAMNWLAASYLNLPVSKQDIEQNPTRTPSVLAIGIDGRPLTLPTVSQQFTFRGNALSNDKTGLTGFALPPANFKAWKPVQVAIGDLPAFSSILGDGITPYKGPAALIGLDILAQRRVVLETGSTRTRGRRVFVSAQ